MLYNLRLFSSECSSFHNADFFGSCIIHILYTECAEIKKNNSGPRVNIQGVYKLSEDFAKPYFHNY